MSKLRVNDMAGEFGISADEVIKLLRQMDVPVRSHMSPLTRRPGRPHSRAVGAREDERARQRRSRASRRRRGAAAPVAEASAACREAPAEHGAPPPARRRDAAVLQSKRESESGRRLRSQPLAGSEDCRRSRRSESAGRSRSCAGAAAVERTDIDRDAAQVGSRMRAAASPPAAAPPQPSRPQRARRTIAATVRCTTAASAPGSSRIVRVRGRSCPAHRVRVQSRQALRLRRRVRLHRLHPALARASPAHVATTVRVRAATIVAAVAERRESADGRSGSGVVEHLARRWRHFAAPLPRAVGAAPRRRRDVSRRARGAARRRGRAREEDSSRQRVHHRQRARRNPQGAGDPDRRIRVQEPRADGHDQPAARLRPDRAHRRRIRIPGGYAKRSTRPV